MRDSPAAAFQHRVATLALAAGRDHGFALAGGQALIAHGIINRATDDIDIFTNHPAGVRRASQAVTAALVAAGYAVASVSEMAELDETFAGFGDDLAELEIRDDQHIVRLQLARFDRHRAPVSMEIGPVLHVDDVLGSKVAAMATRAEPRDLHRCGSGAASMQRRRATPARATGRPRHERQRTTRRDGAA